MNKKQYIKFILKDLKGDWEMADSFLILIDKIDENDEILLNHFYNIFKKSIDKVNNKKIYQKFNESKKNLKTIFLKEEIDLNNEKKDLLKIERELNLV